MAAAAGTKADSVCVPSEIIAWSDSDWGDSLLGDKTHSMIFDNSKIKSIVPDFKVTIPFVRDAKEIMDWYDEDPARQIVDEKTKELVGRIIAAYE